MGIAADNITRQAFTLRVRSFTNWKDWKNMERKGTKRV